jgi:hypothetical protein
MAPTLRSRSGTFFRKGPYLLLYTLSTQILSCQLSCLTKNVGDYAALWSVPCATRLIQILIQTNRHDKDSHVPVGLSRPSSMVTAVTSSLYLFWSLALPCKADYYSTASCRRAANKSKKKNMNILGSDTRFLLSRNVLNLKRSVSRCECSELQKIKILAHKVRPGLFEKLRL